MGREVVTSWVARLARTLDQALLVDPSRTQTGLRLSPSSAPLQDQPFLTRVRLREGYIHDKVFANGRNPIQPDTGPA